MRVVTTVEWVTVESTLFTAAAYRADVRQLYLRFRDGRIYRYFECSVSVYTEFLKAGSKGTYFSQHIRNEFRYELVRRKNAVASGCDGCDSLLAGQLSRSVLLAKATVQKRRAAHSAGVQE